MLRTVTVIRLCYDRDNNVKNNSVRRLCYDTDNDVKNINCYKTIRILTGFHKILAVTETGLNLDGNLKQIKIFLCALKFVFFFICSLSKKVKGRIVFEFIYVFLLLQI